jgi:hypothetical protein
MNNGLRYAFIALWLGGVLMASQSVLAGVLVQCPGDTDG